MVRGAPEKCGSVSNSDEVGSIRSEYRYSSADSSRAAWLLRARSVAACTSRSTSCVISSSAVRIQNTFRDQPFRKSHDGIAGASHPPARLGLVQLFVIGKRVRVGRMHVACTNTGMRLRAAVVHRFAHGREGLEKIRAIATKSLETRKTRRPICEISPPAVWRSTGTEIAQPLSSTRYTTAAAPGTRC